MRGLRPGLQILHGRPFAPLRDCLGVDPQLAAQRRERSLRSLYCCSDGVRGRGAPMTYLSHAASFHSNERIAPANRGIKHLSSGAYEFAFANLVPITAGQLNTITVTGLSRGNGAYGGQASFIPSVVPEPSTWALMFVGFALVGGAARFRRRSTNVVYA